MVLSRRLSSWILISPPGVVKPSTHTRTFPITAPSAAPAGGRAEARRAGGSGLYIPRVCGEPRARGAHTSHRHTRARVRSAPARRRLSEVTSRLPRRRARAALRAPTSFPPWSARSPITAPGKAPGPASPRLLSGTPGSALAAARRGLGRPWPRRPGSGSALTCAAPTGLQPGPAHRGEAAARASPGQPAAGTGSHGARAGCGSGTRPRPPRRPSRGLCVSAGSAADAGWRAVTARRP